jgi:hypothetical protein
MATQSARCGDGDVIPVHTTLMFPNNCAMTLGRMHLTEPATRQGTKAARETRRWDTKSEVREHKRRIEWNETYPCENHNIRAFMFNSLRVVNEQIRRREMVRAVHIPVAKCRTLKAVEDLATGTSRRLSQGVSKDFALPAVTGKVSDQNQRKRQLTTRW